MKVFIIFTALIVFMSTSFAEKKSMSLLSDHRIKKVDYVENEIYPVTTHYGFSTQIFFAPYEKVHLENIEFGIAGAYNKSSIGNMLLIKPTGDAMYTNMVVKTSHRTYIFDVKRHKARKRKPRDMTYALIFNYPEDNVKKSILERNNRKHLQMLENKKTTLSKSISECENFNITKFNKDYTIEGSEDDNGDLIIKPSVVFDDGKFTYIKMDGDHGTIKSYDNGKEEMVNYHTACGYVVVEKVYKRMTIRTSGAVTCIRNQAPIRKSVALNKRG